nr:protein kinase [Anaerolineae bacterium]
METSPASLRPDTIIGGRYRITTDPPQIGGFAEVYRAAIEGDQLGGYVAIKVLKPETAQQPDLAAYFKREGNLLKTITAQNIVRVRELLTHDSRDCLVMDWLQGGDLHVFADRETLGPELLLQTAEGICRGIKIVHDNGIIHGDIKPKNIIMEPFADGLHPVLIDFGISSEKKYDRVIGATPRYVAPEQIGRGGMISAHTDIYMAGVVLYFLFTGGAYYLGEEVPEGELNTYIQDGMVMDITPRLLPGLEPAIHTLRSMINDMLSRVPARRPRIEHVLRGLERVRKQIEEKRPVDDSTAPVRFIGPLQRRLFVQAAWYDGQEAHYHQVAMMPAEGVEDGFVTPGLFAGLDYGNEAVVYIIDEDENQVYSAEIEAYGSPYTITLVFNDRGIPVWHVEPEGKAVLPQIQPLDRITLPDEVSRAVAYPHPVDVVFILDGTMGQPESEVARQYLEAFLDVVEEQQYPAQVGLIIYGEHEDYPKADFTDIVNMPGPALLGSVENSRLYLQYRLPPAGLFRRQDTCDALELALAQAAGFNWQNKVQYLVVVGNSPPHPPGDQREKYELLDWTSDAFGANIDWREATKQLKHREIFRRSVWVRPVVEPPMAPGMKSYVEEVWSTLNAAPGKRTYPEISDPYSIKVAVEKLIKDIWKENRWDWQFVPPVSVPFTNSIR